MSDKNFVYKATDVPAAALEDGQASSMYYNVGTLCSTAGGSRVLWSQVLAVMKVLKSSFLVLTPFVIASVGHWRTSNFVHFSPIYTCVLYSTTELWE